MYKPYPPNLPRDSKQRVLTMVDHEVTWEMPIGLRVISISRGGETYTEKQIRKFAKVLAPTLCAYMANLTDWHHPTYRELWEVTASLEPEWIHLRLWFGDKMVNQMIDKAMEQQDLRARGEIE